MDCTSSDPWVASVVKIEVDVADETPVSWWKKEDQGQGGAVLCLTVLTDSPSCVGDVA